MATPPGTVSAAIVKRLTAAINFFEDQSPRSLIAFISYLSDCLTSSVFQRILIVSV